MSPALQITPQVQAPALQPAPPRDAKGRLLPGQSLNPGGRIGAKGVSARVREMTHDGEDCFRFLLEMLRGDIKCGSRDRLEAARMLLDRAYGRSVETSITVEAGERAAAAALEISDAALESLARDLSARSKGQAPVPAVDPQSELAKAA